MKLFASRHGSSVDYPNFKEKWPNIRNSAAGFPFTTRFGTPLPGSSDDHRVGYSLIGSRFSFTCTQGRLAYPPGPPNYLRKLLRRCHISRKLFLKSGA